MKLVPRLFAFCLLPLLISCNKDDDGTDQTALTNEEAAEVIASSLSEDADGLSVSVATMAAVTSEALAADDGGRTLSVCDYTKDSTFTRTRNTALITSSYNFEYSYQVSCSNLGLPQAMAANLSYSGVYETARASSDNAGDGELALTGLALSENNYVANGTYSRQGSFTSKVRNQNAIQSDLTLTLADLTVDKGTYAIKGGTLSVALTGSVASKGNFSYTASVQFNGAGSATITINGETYEVDLETGEI